MISTQQIIQSLRASLANEQHLLRIQSQEVNKAETRERIERLEQQIRLLEKPPEPTEILGKIIDLLRENGATITSPYDFESWLSDNANWSKLMQTKRFATCSDDCESRGDLE